MGEELEGLELEGLEDIVFEDLESVPGMSAESGSALSKAWEAVREAFKAKGREPASEGLDKATSDKPKAEAKPEDANLEKAEDGGAKALVNAVKAFLKVAKDNWEDLPKAVQTKVDSLAEAVGAPKNKAPEKAPDKAPDKADEDYPEVKKSEYAVQLEKALGEQNQRIVKMEQEIAVAKREKRLLELEPVSKSVGGLDIEKLYQMEELEPTLFAELVKHMEALQARVQTAEFFSKELGSGVPMVKGPADRLHKAATELVEKGEARDYAEGLAVASAMPEYRDLVPGLYAGLGGEA